MTSNEKRSIRLAVRRGAKWMDANRGKWASSRAKHLINLKTLDMGHGARCILGQHHPSGSYHTSRAIATSKTPELQTAFATLGIIMFVAIILRIEDGITRIERIEAVLRNYLKKE